MQKIRIFLAAIVFFCALLIAWPSNAVSLGDIGSGIGAGADVFARGTKQLADVTGVSAAWDLSKTVGGMMLDAAGLTHGNPQEMAAGDKQLDKYMDELSFSNRCWGCGFVGKFTQIADVVAKATFTVLRDDIRTMLMILFAIWILIQGIRLFFPDLTTSPAGVVKSLIGKGLIFSIAIAMLSGTGGPGNAFWDWLYTPTFKVSAEAGKVVFDESVKVLPFAPFPGGGAGNKPCGWFEDIKFGNSTITPSLAVADIQKMTCLIETMQRVNAAGVLLGWNSLTKKKFVLSELFDHILSFITAIILVVVFGIPLFAFPFYFIGVVFRLTFVAALGPILIASAVFNWSRRFAVNAVKIMFVSGLNLVGAALIYAFGAGMMGFAPQLMKFGENGDKAASSLADMLRLVSENGLSITFSDAAFWYLVLCGVFLIVMAGRVSEMMGMIFDISMGNTIYDRAAGLAQKAGGMAIAGATALTLGAAGAIGVAGYGAAAGGAAGAGGALKAAGGKTLGALGRVAALKMAQTPRSSSDNN